MEVTLIYPNQLFIDHPAIKKDRTIYIVRHPSFFSNYKFHKQKILLHFLSTHEYESSLSSQGYNCKIIEENEYFEFKKSILEKVSVIHFCEFIDNDLSEEFVTSYTDKITTKSYQNPMFYESSEDVKKYFGSRKKFQLSNFYRNIRTRHKVLVDENNKPFNGKWSFDTENRKSIPKNLEVPRTKKLSYDQELLEKYKKIIENKYNSNPGSLANFNYPINRKQCLDVLSNFLISKFSLFGNYQDAIISDRTYLFHSVISPGLNIGLITPKEVVNSAIDFSNKSNIEFNSLEGFVRQILGWREFIRGIYITNGKSQKESNYWEAKNKLPKSFYDGNTNLLPVDDSINKVNKYAYLHHIERLMVLGNIMLLLEINPNDINRWFMELFIDSYEWVMIPNIYGMSQFSDGGLMSTKPYISSSNYILKMSNYKKEDWCKIWDSLFWQFISKHQEKLKINQRMSFMTSLYSKKSESDKEKIKKISEDFKEKIL
ncbi:MAG: cryptochrome/photolyase family protein [SAR202 cluster bacterium]|nr:cryptochrome/photolyase family protein [SAR202 cluster bacterium]|tara:strand:+ start:254 stop:1711 length:1458 start_codon:yes stop_codon:yes gene_type:complete